MPSPKKLIVLCDGTWQNADVGWEKDHFWEAGHPQIPTNVTRISRAILPESETGPQIVYYQNGVGSQSYSYTDQFLGGGLAIGLSENVREAYGFLAHNYNGPSDDEIYLFGFSRGAFTARSVAGMICSIGLLTKDSMKYFYYVFEDFENAGRDGYVAKLPGALPEFVLSKNSATVDEYLAEYKAKLLKLGLTRDVRIDAIGVWDTVGSLGLPVVPLLQRLGFPTSIHKYRFFDTGISNNVKNAFQALALDERRLAFQATVWEKKPDNHTTNLVQVWFAGCHSNIGGGYDDSSMADLTLAWMIDKFTPFIAFNQDYLLQQVDANIAANFATKEHPEKPVWQWGLGKVYDSLTFPTNIAGTGYRNPGRYLELDYESNKPKTPITPLQQTNEYVHASVRARYNYGLDAWGAKYNTQPLQPFKQVTGRLDDGRSCAVWEYTGSDAVGAKVLREAPLGKMELKLLEKDPEMKSNLFLG